VELADGGQAGLDAFRAAKQRGEMFDVVVTIWECPSGRSPTGANPQERIAGDSYYHDDRLGTLIKGEDLPPQVDCMLNKPPRIGSCRKRFESDSATRHALNP